jgi:HPt (histidine-containing phosphotransfer) domain-containing protein
MGKTQTALDPELRGFIPQYIKNRRADLIKMSDALNKNDLKTINEVCHQIKGHALGYGFKILSEICQKIEIATQSNSKEKIILLLKEYGDYINQVKDNV